MNLDVNNIAYGQGFLIQDKAEQLIQINKTYDSFTKYEQARTETQKRMSIVDPTICRLMKFTTSEQKSFCGQLFGISLQYQYTEKCIGQLKRLSQFDCLAIIKDVTQALLYFISKRIRHGQLNPQTILVSSNNRYQLTDIRFITDLFEYKLQLIGFTNSCYLAPNLVYELGKRTQNPIYNYEKSEVFSLGLVILEMALQQNVQSIYDLSKFFVSQDTINTYLRVMREKNFTTDFIDLLSKMLQVDETQRIDLYQLEKLVGGNQKVNSSILSNPKIYDKFVNSKTLNNSFSSSPKPVLNNYNKTQTQTSYFTNNYSTTHQETQPTQIQNQQNQMTFYQTTKQNNNNSNYHSRTPTQANQSYIIDYQKKQSPDTVESYKLYDNRRIKTEQSDQLIFQHSTSSFISPEKKQDNQLDKLFNQFDNNLQKVKQKIHHLRINTPSSQNQSFFQSNHSVQQEPVDEFPTFKPDMIPNQLDLQMDPRTFQQDFRELQNKNLNFSVLEKPNYYTNSFYDDMKDDAKLPTSGTIHMHSSGPTTLSDFFLRKK